jgi:hypothetical protein
VAARGEAARRVTRQGKAGRRRVEAVRIEGEERTGRAQPIRARRDKAAQAGDVARGYKPRRSRGGVAMRRACDKAGRGGAMRCADDSAAAPPAAGLGATQRT